jgi:multicomponent Na+:H+ antiporter subunit D
MTLLEAPWIVWVVLTPLVAAVLTFLRGRATSGPGVIASGATVLVTALLARQVWLQGAQRYALGGWGAPLGVELQADGISVTMLLLTAVVGFAVSVYAASAMGAWPGSALDAQHPVRVRFFWPLWLTLWAGLHALFLSADLFTLYVTLEVVSLSAVALVAQAGSTKALAAALRYLLAALAGSLCYLLGVSLLYGAYGVLDIATLGRLIAADKPSLVPLAAITVGLLLKTALFPLHFWLPPAHGSAPAPVSAVLSGLVVKASFYVLARLWLDVFPVNLPPLFGSVLATCGALAIVWGSAQAFAVSRVKMLVAYSTVAQVGYLFLVFALVAPGTRSGAWTGALLFAVSHGCAKAAMFLAAGNLRRAIGHDRLTELDTVGHRLPVTFFTMGLAAVTLMGLPPSGTFVAKWILIDAAVQSGQYWLAGVVVGGGLLAAGYLVPLVGRAFTGTAIATEDPIGRVPMVMRWAPFALAALAAGLGLLAWPLSRFGSLQAP